MLISNTKIKTKKIHLYSLTKSAAERWINETFFPSNFFHACLVFIIT